MLSGVKERVQRGRTLGGGQRRGAACAGCTGTHLIHLMSTASSSKCPGHPAGHLPSDSSERSAPHFKLWCVLLLLFGISFVEFNVTSFGLGFSRKDLHCFRFSMQFFEFVKASPLLLRSTVSNHLQEDAGSSNSLRKSSVRKSTW